MLVVAFPAGPWATNCYVVSAGPGAECVVVDPGKDAAAGVADVVREHRLRPAAVLLTHGHIDHIWCVAPVAGAYESAAYIHPADRHLLTDPMAGISADSAAMLLGGAYEFAEPDVVCELGDGQHLSLAGLDFIVDHTPGHTAGSVTFRSPYDDQEVPELMFSGDLLFAGSIGRTDLPGGDHPTMLRSLVTKVLPLDDAHRGPARARRADDHRPRAGHQPVSSPARLGSHQRQAGPGPMSPRSLSGFPELLPAQRNAELAVIETLRRVFELHGFAGIETRAVEPLDVLLKNGEIDKEVYLLRRLQAEDESSDAGLGLHYDLTVPFARYVLENAGKLEFPFRRYQIQKAWRGERPQDGRFREFTQADVDVVMKDDLPFHFDIEIARVIAEALVALPLPPLRLEVNNRKLIEGFYRGLGIPDPAPVIRLADKLDKLPAERVAALMVSDAGLTSAQAESCLGLATIVTSDGSFVDRVRALGVEHPLLDVGLDELEMLVEACSDVTSDRFAVEANLRIARGLDYYTGTVFEIFMDGYESLGSVGGGGRYDALATDGATTYPGVGISFGISRTLVPLLTRGVLTGSRSVPSAVLVALVDEASRGVSTAIAQRLRARGVATEVAVRPQKYGRQIRYAERRGIPFVWFPGHEGAADQVRDIRSGDQSAADADGWLPPAADLRPSVVTKETG